MIYHILMSNISNKLQAPFHQHKSIAAIKLLQLKEMNLLKQTDLKNGSSSSAATPCYCSWNFKWMRNPITKKTYNSVQKEESNTLSRDFVTCSNFINTFRLDIQYAPHYLGYNFGFPSITKDLFRLVICDEMELSGMIINSIVWICK